MTELEYEKAARGYIFADTSQFAWGSKNAVSAAAINRGGQANEVVSTPLANAAYGNGLTGPLKVGAFSQNSFGRVSSGSGYFGAMELSGNISEICISIGNTGGRSYTGIHGDGMISTTLGFHNVTAWPGSNAVGVGRRGGNWQDVLNLLRISDRKQMNQNIDSRSSVSGGRGVRTVACQLPTTMPAIINGIDYAGAFSQINFQTSGAINYLWKLPNEMQLLTGQGSDSIVAISPGSYALSPRFIMLVSAVNGCGAGPERSRNINIAHFSNYDSAFIYNNYRIYVFHQVGTRNVTLFENIDSVRVVVVGGGGDGGNLRGGGGGSGRVRLRNDISLFSNSNLSVKVGNRLESSDFSNILIANPGTSGGSGRGVGGSGGSGGGGTGSTSAGGDGGTNGSKGVGSSGSGGGRGGNFDSLTLLNDISGLFSPGTGGTRGSGTGGGGGGGGGLVFNNSTIKGAGLAGGFGNAGGGQGYGGGGGGGGYSGAPDTAGAQGIIVIGVKIR
jgi:hypothetical protein